MIISAFVFAVAEPRESIKIQLALERGILGLIEVVRHDFIDKLLGFVDHESSSMRLPANHRVVTLSIHFIEHIMELPRKWCRYSTFGDRFSMLILTLYARYRAIGIFKSGGSVPRGYYLLNPLVPFCRGCSSKDTN